MRLSVVIPVYNRAHSIAPALESVLAQTRPADEVIVVDDGSTDDLKTALAPYMDRIRLIRQDNGGAARARNAGAAAATGDWLTFQDSDDLWSPDHLEVVARDVAGADDGVVAHLGDVTYVGEGYRETLFQIKRRSFPAETAKRIERPLDLMISGMTLQGAAVRATAWQRLGGLDAGMRIYEDTDFFCRLALSGDFLVTGRNLAEILRLEGDGIALTGLEKREPLYCRRMIVRYLEGLLPMDMTQGQRGMVRRSLSGALFRQAEVEAHSDRRAALRSLLRAARLHPDPLTGWGKSAAAGLLGRRGFRMILPPGTWDRS